MNNPVDESGQSAGFDTAAPRKIYADINSAGDTYIQVTLSGGEHVHNLTEPQIEAILEAALSTDAEPVAWYWEDATGCFHITLDRPDVKQMAAIVGCKPKPLYAVHPAPSVAVKALEWVQSESKTTWTAETPFGRYFIHQIRTLDFSVFHDGKSSWATKAIYLSEAKAAAQSDYDARIRSSLSAQVQDVVARPRRLERENACLCSPVSEKCVTATGIVTCNHCGNVNGRVITAAPAAKLEGKP